MSEDESMMMHARQQLEVIFMCYWSQIYCNNLRTF